MTLFPHKSCYFTLLGVAIFDGGALALSHVRVDPLQLAIRATAILPLLWLALAASMGRPGDSPMAGLRARVSCFCQGIVFLTCAWTALRLLDHLTMRITAGIGYADGLLARFDRLIGLHWTAYFETLQSSHFLVTVLARSYTSLTVCSVIAFLVISCCRDLRRPQFFVEAFFFSAIACIVIGMLFPARGAVAFHLGDSYNFTNFAAAPGEWFLHSLTALRGDQPVLLDLDNLPGLVTFPSFHVAAITVIVFSCRRTALLLPALLYGAVVAAATPIFGGHYFIDLLGGLTVAIAVVSVLERQPRFSGLFAAEPAATSHSMAAGKAF